MRIGELSRRTGVPSRLLRYYEQQGLLSPERDGNGYRSYQPSAVYCVQQIRGLLDAGLTTDIIGRILPFLTNPRQIHLPAECLTADTAELLDREADRLQRRIDCLTRNLHALRAYRGAIEPSRPPNPARSQSASGFAATGSAEGASLEKR